MSGRMEIRPDEVRGGVQAWEAAYARLDSAVQAARGGIPATPPAAVFGADAAGQAAANAYREHGGPAELLFGDEGGGMVLAQLGAGGPAMSGTLEDALAQEAANAAAMTALGGAGAGVAVGTAPTASGGAAGPAPVRR